MPTTETITSLDSNFTPAGNHSPIKVQLRQFIRENFLYAMPSFELGDDDLLMERGVVDSMGVAEMIAFVENEFSVFTADEDITETNFGSVNAIARFVAARSTM